MALPVMAGLATGQVRVGLTIGLGAMLLAGGTEEGGETPRSPAAALLPGLAAVLAATALVGRAGADVVTVLLATAAAVVSGYSRPVGVGAIRFVVYLVLALNLAEGAGAHPGGAMLVFGLGALWNMVLRLLLAGRPAAPGAPARVVTAAQRRTHFVRTLRTFAGWQFAIRMGAGLALAEGLHRAWPQHHYGWIVLTVALLTRRAVEIVPVKATQRVAGTAAGVAATGVLLALATAAGGAARVALAVVLCLLAAAVPAARARSYALYAVLATPVILLVLDAGKPADPALLVDRLVATLIGGAIVVGLNVAIARAMRLDRASGATASSQPDKRRAG